ncbi:hypothetical protein Poli38472_004734 [Pythium oligandrum]|uniref:RING-type domain-containing protein n=1 Tax=Pythium oligandrum TaxID=41045 RepID=A0A8K1CAS4_PYTOL|nr:hypothetical protein Poli38472_004734 [Pythium oligandrum]|eukprot:TMW59665.1 hypothetical protein Poli38472_004734 [Pythium oligandrum]
MGETEHDDVANEQPTDETLDQVDVTLDLRLPTASEHVDSNIDDDESPLAVCQICMDVFGSKEIVRGVCGDECLAEVCESCLVQALSATVYSFYPGVLPKMRCPVCLTLLNKRQWSKFVQPIASNGEQEDPNVWQMDHSHVLDKYEMLCRQSCGFQSPCCHNPEYTMLPSTPKEKNLVVTMTLPTAEAEMVPELIVKYHEYCFHRIQPDELYDFVVASFDENAESVLDALLHGTPDEERQAALQLYLLFLDPNTRTKCCDYVVCFKCKAANHHDGKCNDFTEDQCVLDCPGCHVTLVKVDGCDSVTCLCGFSIDWPVEMEKQRLQRKQLAPAVDKTYRQWRSWATQLDRCLEYFDNLDKTWRGIRLQKMIRDHRGALRVLMRRTVRRARLNLMIEENREKFRNLLLRSRREAKDEQVRTKNINSNEQESSPIAVAA